MPLPRAASDRGCDGSAQHRAWHAVGTRGLGLSSREAEGWGSGKAHEEGTQGMQGGRARKAGWGRGWVERALKVWQRHLGTPGWQLAG